MLVTIVVTVAVIGAAVALALVSGGGEEESVVAPSSAATAAEPASPTSSPTQSPEPSPSPESEEGTLSIDGIELRLVSATRKERYVQEGFGGTGDQIFTPTLPGDIFLIVRGTFESDSTNEAASDRLQKWKTVVIDDRGRRDGPSITTTSFNETAGGAGEVEWAFIVSQSSSSYTLELEGTTIDLTPLLG